MDEDIADVEEFIDDEFNELVALADDSGGWGDWVDVDNTEVADDTEEDNDVDADGKLFGNVDDNDAADEEDRFDDDNGGPVVEMGIVPPGGADPVLFGRPAPTVLSVSYTHLPSQRDGLLTRMPS